MQKQLTQREQRLMRHWFKKTDGNTIELKEKRWGGAKLIFGMFFLVLIFYDFFHPNYKEFIAEELKFAFQPETRFQQEFYSVMDSSNPTFTRFGETKDEFMAEMWERHKNGVWLGYLIVAKYVPFFIYFLWPARRRVRFDRKRSIIYTYINKKFYLTEVNKLMRPFPEYISFIGGMVCFWVHPYKQIPRILRGFSSGSQMVVSDYTMWLPMIVAFIPGMYEKSKGALLKRFLVDFMNPDTPPERIESMLQALEAKRTWREWVVDILFGWLDGGLYCRKLPKQDVLEHKIEKYFAEDAPNIVALPSCKLGTFEESRRLDFKFEFMKIITVEENIHLGYAKVPCPDLYEYPRMSLHFNSLGTAWGNEKIIEAPPPRKKGKKKLP